MKHLMRMVSMFLAVVMVFTLLPAQALAAESSGPVISVESVTAAPGATIDVNVMVTQNTGILGATMILTYDEGLTLTDVAAGEALSYLTMSKPETFTSPCTFIWDGLEYSDADLKDGVVMTLTFEVAEGIEDGKKLNISVDAPDGDIYDNDLNVIDVSTTSGAVTVVSYLPGDVNSDKAITTADPVLLRRYLVGTSDTTINRTAGNVNGDYKLNTADLILIRRFIAGGYDVELYPSPISLEHIHTMQAIAYVSPTCTETGNIAYWHCTDCGKYYSDEYGVNEVTLEDTVLDALGHTPVTIPAVEPTETTEGSTEGSECSVCGAVLVEPEPIPPVEPETRTITYNIANGDTYLATLDIDNPNPTTLKTTESYTLDTLEVPGYHFLGWYDLASGPNAEIVKQIEPGEGNITLYAHWELESDTNTITYNYDPKLEGLIDTSKLSSAKTYDVNVTTKLPVLALDGYTFIGWSDEEGNLCTQINPGSVGEKHFYANWISNRSQAWTKKNLDDPYIYDNEEVILFCYEIGKITDVPIDVIEDFGLINASGITQTTTKKMTVQSETALVEAYSEAVEQSTTDNATWTFSDGWSDTISINEEYAQERGKTVEEIEEESRSETNNWYVNTTNSNESTSTTINSTDTYNLATTTNNIKTYGSTDTTIYDNTTNLSGYEINGSIKGNIKGVVEISVDGGYENKTTTKDGTDTVNKTGSDEDEGSGSQSGTIKNHTSNTVDTSTWSNETGYGGSEVNEKTQTVAQAISELISEKQSIGETYLTTGSETNSQGLSSTNANKNEFSSQVTYSQVASEEIEVTYTTNTAISGYHRWVMAVTAYVYGVVGYDVANECYFTYTYSVMDDDYHKYQDYSYENSEYSDNLSSVIDFCIPSDITDYVESRVFAPDGMEFDLNGNVTAYNGDDSLVIIPDYVAVELNDGTKAAVKVTGIGADVFRGNENITGVTFSDYITEIPAGAFMGCTNLWDITAAGVTKIGEAAFAGCPHFGNFTLSSDVTELGENVLSAIEIPDRTELKEVELADVQFSTGTAYFEVEAANAGVVESAIKSGAAEITIDLGQMSDSVDNQTLTIPEGTEVFVIRGRGASYNDLTIVSHADVTRLSRMTIHSSGSLPLELYSKEVGLNQITVDASSAALALLADNTEVNLYGPNNLTSSANTLFVKNATLGKLDGNLSTSLNVGGNIVTCGSISDSDGYLKQSNGEVLVVDLDTFNNLLRSYNLIFDANGGVCETESVEVANGVAIGELPVPTREYFTFEGWYTAAENGDLVTSETAFSSGTDVTIYAHWAPNEYTATWTEEKGATITVERTDSPYAVAELGALESGAVVYYGDMLSVTYAPATGFELGECGETEITVSGDVTEESIFAHANGLAYTVSWNTGTGYKIAVSRTESPDYGAETGALDSGDTVYYGDVLEISYTAAEGYTLVDSGETEITVTGDVGSGRIYASATPNNYTYNVVYRSSNGTNLGSTTVTKAFGTRNTISAPAKSGYTTPASQTVKWDSTTPKTITFTYGIKGVSGSQAMSSGNWNIWSGKYGVTYSASAEYRNRTATSVQIRVKWTNTLTANTYYGFAQYFTAKIGGISAGEKQIASSSTWATMSSSSRSATAYSGWVTVPVSATSRSVSISATYRDLNGVSGSWSKTMTIPTY